MITTEMVYWIIMLDRINVAFLSASIVLGVVLLAFTLGTIADKNEFKWPYPVWVAFELFFICGAVFLPNTKQMATIYLLPKVINDEKIQSIGGRAIDTGDKLLQLMQQYISEKTTDKKQP